MATLTITSRGQVTLRKDVLQHLGIKPGEQIEFDKLPDGELRLRAAKPRGNINGFIGLLAENMEKPLIIENMSEIASSGWSGER